jgi:hypothetical protein
VDSDYLFCNFLQFPAFVQCPARDEQRGGRPIFNAYDSDMGTLPRVRLGPPRKTAN